MARNLAENDFSYNLSPKSMAESVTRHAQNPSEKPFQFLLAGIDTLDLGLYVVWDANWKDVCSYLEAKKQEAQGKDRLLDESVSGREYFHFPSGKGSNYRFRLQFTEYQICIAASEEYKQSPNVYVSILASVLWHEGISLIIELLEYDLNQFGGTIDRIQPSRCDLCVDFKLSSPLEFPFIQKHRVSRSRKQKPFLNSDTLETYYCGSPKSPVQVRIYDKGNEISLTNKQWFLNLWGLDDPVNVWRAEFQLRRAFLKQFKIKTLDDLWQKIGSIWEYLTNEWFSLRLPDNDKAERRTIHPWWKAVQDCGPLFGESIGTKRDFSNDSTQPIGLIMKHIISRATSIAVIKEITDREKLFEQLGQYMRAELSEEKFKTEYKKKAIKLGYQGVLGGVEDVDE